MEPHSFYYVNCSLIKHPSMSNLHSTFFSEILDESHAAARSGKTLESCNLFEVNVLCLVEAHSRSEECQQDKE